MADRTTAAAVIGGGPAGLMAAEALAATGVRVDVFEAMPSVGRKLLMAGKSGLNLTHAEPIEIFLQRYGSRRNVLEPAVRAFAPDDVRIWAAGLGVETFVGTSGRVFPTNFKAAPLLRAWVHRLRAAGVAFHMRHRWRGWEVGETLLFDTPQGSCRVRTEATVLALGGASWPHLGSDAAWVPLLRRRGVPVVSFRPANCGFDVPWSGHFRDRFAGHPVKAVALSFQDRRLRGEFVVTRHGIEGSAVYALSAALRDTIAESGHAVLSLDLAPDRNAVKLTQALSRPRGSRSWSNHLRRTVGLEGVKAGLLREFLGPETFDDPARLAASIKRLPLRLVAPRPLAEAISTAGGVRFEDLDRHYMVHTVPGLFCAGEMLDWEAPTGGYLLTACLATGRAAGVGAAEWLRTKTQQASRRDTRVPAVDPVS